jgi:murein DD-endopeptidase MepM/ murein hydrolase activator NlpD
MCSYSSLVLQPPIAPSGNQYVERSYPFGSTQGGLRDPHHGVEFINPLGMPVLAAADGIVKVAGDDRNALFGPYWYFYGNLVVLEHTLPGQVEPFFTLYGHLSQINVKEGQRVQAGQQIGQVGMTGIATGTHLHFEVRVGENSYKNSRNAELWLAAAKEESQSTGAIAGRIQDNYGNLLPVPSIIIEHLPAPDQPADLRFYTSTYEEKALLGQPPFGETFALGDLPPGWYRLSFVQYGMQERLVQVKPGELTYVSFRLGGS